MLQSIQDKFSREELELIVRRHQISAAYLDDFLFFLEYELKQESDEEYNVEKSKSEAVKLAIEDFRLFEAQIEKGHGKQWAQLYAISIEEHPHSFNRAYREIKEIDAIKSKEELIIHCNAMGGDEYYTKHFIFLMENGAALSDPDKQAARYSAIYKEQIALGKSEVFAHEYADTMASCEYREIYCYAYARCYDQAVNDGKSFSYAKAIAAHIAEYYANNYSRTSEIEYNQFDLLNESKIKEQYKNII
ncbi:MAG: hypothetical protein ACK5XN_35530 [Bacteroidota bacterium]|jgi:hypothetical protein